MDAVGSWSLVAKLSAYAFADSQRGCDVHVALSPDGRHIITMPYSTSFFSDPLDTLDIHPLIWEAESGELLLTLRHPERASHFALSSDGRHVITTSCDNKLRIWDIESGDLLKTTDIDEDTSGPHEGGLLINTSEDSLQITNAESGEEVRVLRDGGPWNRYAISADGLTVVEGSLEGWIQYWNSEGNKGLLQSDGPIVTCVGVSPDGRRVVAGSTMGEVQVWDSADGSVLDVRYEPGCTVNSVTLNADGHLIIASLRNGPLKIWNINTGTTAELPAYDAYSNNLGVSADGRRVVVAHGTGIIDIWGESSKVRRTKTLKSATVQIGDRVTTLKRLTKRVRKLFQYRG